jgi:hypothetical protein
LPKDLEKHLAADTVQAARRQIIGRYQPVDQRLDGDRFFRGKIRPASGFDL